MSRRTFRSPPLGVQIMAVLVGLDGLVSLTHGLGLLGAAFPLGLLLIGVGALHFLVAYGLWELEPYAYTWGMGVFALGLVTDFLTGNVSGAGFSVVNMLILYRYRGLFRD